MSDAIKKRLAYAKEAARRDLERLGFSIIRSDNLHVCLIACVPGVYEKKIIIRIDEITPLDLAALRALRIMPNQTKAIWCKQEGGEPWKIIEYDYQNKSVRN